MSNDYNQILTSWGQGRIEAIKAAYNSKGLKASGDFGNSLEQNITITSNKLQLVIKGNKQIDMMTSGRKRNTKQSPEQIKAWVGWAGSTILRKWVQDKRLSLNPFAVAYKIARDGVKVPNPHNDGRLLTDTLTKQSIDELLKNLTIGTLENVKSKYIETWQ